MAEDIRDRLINNLEEVDKSLRRSYIFQIILCLLYLYLFYNAITVADQTKSINNQINQAKCALGEFDKVKDFIRELANERYSFYEVYKRKIRELSEKFQIKGMKVEQLQQKSSFDELDQTRTKKALYEYYEELNDALNSAGNLAQNISEVNLDDLIVFVRVLKPLDPTTRGQVKQFLDQDPDIVNQLQIRDYLESDNRLRGIQEVSDSKNFIDHTCSLSESLTVFGTSQAIKISNRLAVLESIHNKLGNKNDILKHHIENHESELSKQRQKLQDTNISEINIPFAGQSMNTSFAFRIGPFVILLIQFLICSYFRHRYGLIKKIKSSFETAAESDQVKLDDLHLILWPWILNFPYYKSDKYKAERQRGALIIELLLSFFQYLPIITIAAIAIRPIYFGTTGSLETKEINLTDWAFIVTSTILLFTTFLQVRYSRNLDWQITELLGWKKVEAEIEPAIGVKPVANWGIKFALLLIAGVFSNFSINVSDRLSIDLTVVPTLLTLYAGYRFGRIKALIFGALLSGIWIIPYFMQMIEGYGFDPAFLNRPMSLDALSIPHSSLLALVRLSLLGYFSGWAFEHIRTIISENQLSLSQPPAAEKLSTINHVKKVFFTIAAVVAIIIANLGFWWFPTGLAIVVCAVFAYRLGPRLGAVAGVTAILIPYMLMYALHIEGRINFQGFGPMLCFGLIGYWSGYIGRAFKYQRNEIQLIGTKLSLWSTESAKGNGSVPILIIFLVISASIYFIFTTDFPFKSHLRIVLLPLPTVIIMLIGSFCGPRKAAWMTGISLSTLLVISYTASVYGWRLEFSLTENTLFGVRLFRWSFVSIGIWIIAAYWSGKINLINSRRNQYWFAITIFAAFQMASILRYGNFLTLSSVLARVGDIRLDIITFPSQLLVPWLTVLFFNIFLKWLNPNPDKPEPKKINHENTK